ncbi:hypothetical protein AXF42_Ash004362 [Apostasia shenzhenica]|uniref:Protein CLT2, chloroplastic n=1 Tax=Apostasia shenzhenica TaxID=1088818 RepID=A0A2I0A2P4_9ASPA|nr:hypothetical protein AXF42_Ash004362 [Apostasia shenzhenica]
MEFSSSIFRPISSPHRILYSAEYPFTRNPRRHSIISSTMQLHVRGFVSRDCGGGKSLSSILLMRNRLIPPVLASKRKAELKSDVVDDGRIAVAATITVALAVANRVLYKLALVPMRRFPFFLAQVTTFGYVAVYFSILYLRFYTGIVTTQMLAVPKSRFMAIGLLEALGVAVGMSAAAMLPGPTIPILSQTFLVWQLVLSVMILERRYSLIEICGCLLVTVGVILAVVSGSSNGQLLSGVGFQWPALMVVSSAFQAGASILKEFVFIDGAKRLQGKSLDIFVVNSFGSGFQAFFVFLLLPFLSNLRGIPFTELPQYLKNGAACFLNIGSNMIDCEGAPWLPLLYILNNMAFNISLLNLVRRSSAVVSSLAVTLSVPLSIFILSCPLPYIPEGANLNAYFILGTAILVLGLVLYNLPKPANQLHEGE